jgi:hypothetical protein
VAVNSTGSEKWGVSTTPSGRSVDRGTSASSTQFTRFRWSPTLSASSAWCGLRPEKNPDEKPRKSNLVLLRRDASRTLPPVRLRYVDSPRGLCPIRSTVHPTMQIDQSILSPVSYSCHVTPSTPGEACLFKVKKPSPQQINRYMLEQSGEPFLLPLLRCFSHTAQPLRHSFPALCVGLVRDRTMFSLARALASPTSVEGCPSLFGWSSVIRPGPTPKKRACPTFGFAPARTGLDLDRIEALWRSPGSRACGFSACASSTTMQDRTVHSRLTWSCCLPLPFTESASCSAAFRSSIVPPTDSPVYDSTSTSRCSPQDSGPRWSTTCRFIPALEGWPTTRTYSYAHVRALRYLAKRQERAIHSANSAFCNGLPPSVL